MRKWGPNGWEGTDYWYEKKEVRAVVENGGGILEDTFSWAGCIVFILGLFFVNFFLAAFIVAKLFL